LARIPLSELVRVLSEHPEFRERWLAGVPAEKALCIVLGGGATDVEVESETFDAADGSLVVLDRDPEGRVYGIEIA
jgi:hypothetical protein